MGDHWYTYYLKKGRLYIKKYYWYMTYMRERHLSSDIQHHVNKFVLYCKDGRLMGSFLAGFEFFEKC